MRTLLVLALAACGNGSGANGDAGKPHPDATLFSNVMTFELHADDNASITNNEIGEVGDGTIALSVNFADVTALKPYFLLNLEHSTLSVGGVVQTSRMSAQDFTNPVTYTLTGPDGEKRDYVVTIAQGHFLPRLVVPTGMGSVAIASGDIDRDGRQDLVTANATDGTISVILGTTPFDSIAESFAAHVDFPCAGVASIALADVNGDGKLDIIAASPSTSTLSILLNTTTSSTPTFAAKVDFAASPNATSVVIADFDGDNRPDIALASPSGVVSVFLDATPADATTPTLAARVDLASGAMTTSVAVIDFNRDGRADLVATNSGDDTVSLFQNGGGIFGSAQHFATASGPRHVAVGDLDGDGKPDLAVGAVTAGVVSVLMNTSVGPAASFTPKTDVGQLLAANAIAILDLNGDGVQDIIVANEGGGSVPRAIHVLPNRTMPNATKPAFGTPLDFATTESPTDFLVSGFSAALGPDLAYVTSSAAASVLVKTPALIPTPI